MIIDKCCLVRNHFSKTYNKHLCSFIMLWLLLSLWATLSCIRYGCRNHEWPWSPDHIFPKIFVWHPIVQSVSEWAERKRGRDVFASTTGWWITTDDGWPGGAYMDSQRPAIGQIIDDVPFEDVTKLRNIYPEVLPGIDNPNGEKYITQVGQRWLLWNPTILNISDKIWIG